MNIIIYTINISLKISQNSLCSIVSIVHRVDDSGGEVRLLGRDGVYPHDVGLVLVEELLHRPHLAEHLPADAVVAGLDGVQYEAVALEVGLVSRQDVGVSGLIQHLVDNINTTK